MDDINPRYPHWCRIIRKQTDDPMKEEEDFSPLSSDGSASVSSEGYDPLTEDANVVTDNGTTITVIYEGKCRSYEKNTTSDKGEVITSYRGLALPLNQDGWKEIGVAPEEGDEIIVKHDVFTEYGRVIDKNVATAQFAGTHLVWKYGRN